MSGTVKTVAAMLAAASACAAAAVPKLPQTGTIFEAKAGTRLGLWRYAGGGLYGERGQYCCFVVFEYGNSRLLVLTERLMGTGLQGRLQSSLIIRVTKNERETIDCVIDGLVMSYAVWQRRDNSVTGYYVDRDHIASITRPLKALELYCDFDHYDE
jgi:hypothetical protein